jgi:LPS sulfotransferase NodH
MEGTTTKFFVAGIQRTGTTLLTRLLDSTEGTRCFGEIFLRRRELRNLMIKYPTASIDGGYGKYLRRNFSNRLEFAVARKRSIYAYLDDLFSTPDYTTIGFKLMGSQADHCPAVLEYLREHEVKGIHVVRRNFLKTLISRETAETRSLYHMHEDKKFSAIAVSPKSLVRKLESIEGEYQQWKERLVGSTFTTVYYEELSANRDSEFGRIREFLGLAYRTEPSTTMKKINPDRLEDSISNFHEIAEALVGTKYEGFLE